MEIASVASPILLHHRWPRDPTGVCHSLLPSSASSGSLGSWDYLGVRRLSIVCMSTRCRFLDLVPTAKYLDACHDSQRVLPIIGILPERQILIIFRHTYCIFTRYRSACSRCENITTRLLQSSAFAYDPHRPCPTTHSMQVVTRLSLGNLHGASSLHTQPADRQTFAFTCSPLSRHVGRTWLIRNLCLSFRGIPGPMLQHHR